MSYPITDHINLYRFPWGRERYSLRQAADALSGVAAVADLRDELVQAIAACDAARALDDRWRSATAGKHGPRAKALDAELDRTLGALSEALAVLVKAHGEDSSRGRLAAAAGQRLFPRGVRLVTNLPYVMQAEEVDLLLRTVEEDAELAETLRELGVQEFLERVLEVQERYRQELQAFEPDAPTSAEVKAARQARHERLCWIVALLLARLWASEEGSDVAAALELALGAIRLQNAAIKRYYRTRNGGQVSDVDPETGEEVAEPEGEQPAAPLELDGTRDADVA